LSPTQTASARRSSHIQAMTYPTARTLEASAQQINGFNLYPTPDSLLKLHHLQAMTISDAGGTGRRRTDGELRPHSFPAEN